jgi:hypothetical protein
MRERRDELLKLWDAAVEEHDKAVDELCVAVKNVAVHLGRGETPSFEELTQEQSARLRLENARALLTFGVGIRTPGPR